jgi:hypothetical protein
LPTRPNAGRRLRLTLNLLRPYREKKAMKKLIFVALIISVVMGCTVGPNGVAKTYVESIIEGLAQDMTPQAEHTKVSKADK